MTWDYNGPSEGLVMCWDFGSVRIHAARFARECENVTLYTGADGTVRQITGRASRLFAVYENPIRELRADQCTRSYCISFSRSRRIASTCNSSLQARPARRWRRD